MQRGARRHRPRAAARLTLPGSASRARQPRPTGRGTWVARPVRGDARRARSFVDLIPVFYATALLHGLGHPGVGPAVDVTVSPVAPYLSMMDALEYAAQISTSGNLSLLDLESTVRAALADVAGDLKGELVNDS